MKSSFLLLALGTMMTATACGPEESCAETATCPPGGSDASSDKGGAGQDQAAHDGSVDERTRGDGASATTDIRVDTDASDSGRGEASNVDSGTSDGGGDTRDASVDGSTDVRTADAPGIDVAMPDDSTSDVTTPDITTPDVSSPDVASEDAADGGDTIDVVVGCSATTCPMGCCSDNACKPYAGQNDMSCGTGGAACALCGADKACSAGGTCVTIADDIWAVGAGTILHWTKATAWEIQPSPSAELTDVWGTDRSNVWAVGHGGTILHYDGTQWTAAASPTTQSLSAVWGSSRTDVWAVGYDSMRQRGVVIRFDGNAWQDWGAASAWDNFVFQSLSGTGPRDVWIAAASASGDPVSRMFHFGPLANWTDMTAPGAATTYLTSIWMTPNGGWVVGRDPTTVLRFNGTSWTAPSPMPTTSNPKAVSGISANDVWTIGWYAQDTTTEIVHFNGAVWTPVQPETYWPLMNDLFARSASDVWFVGFSGNILHYDGLRLAGDATSPTQAILRGVWGVR